MGGLIAALAALLLAPAGFAQTKQDQPFQEAGVCARCHVISVIEWGMSGHRKAATGCESCHGASLGHVRDERNNAKPDRIPRAGAIAALCAACHKAGCPKGRQTASCQDCHHAHALLNASQPAHAAVKSEQRASGPDPNQGRFSNLMEDGTKLLAAGRWREARSAFQAALVVRPGDSGAGAKLALCERRLKPVLPGFTIDGAQFDVETGLARNVRVTGMGIPMVLIPGGSFEMGSDQYEGARPVHTARVRPFYLGTLEITQAEWKVLMNTNPSAHQGDQYPDAARMPVEQISWNDAQAFLIRLNEKVEGGGFRLATEAEWEYAARTGGATAEVNGPAGGSPHAGGKSRADTLGLHEMLGNVWEWTSSLSRPYPFDPADGRESAAEPGLRILRGGGFIDPADLMNPAFRHAERPDRRLRWNGLRIARDVPAPR